MKNKGMLFEKLINQTIKWFNDKNIAYIDKLNLPIKFSSMESDVKGNLWLKNAKVVNKSTVDYVGCYRGQFIAFEAKSTKSDRLEKSNIKINQIEYLKKIDQCGGISFYIIYFEKFEKILCVPLRQIQKLLNSNESISYANVIKYSIVVDIIVPGILNLENVMKFWN